MEIWEWELGRLKKCVRDYDMVGGHVRLFGRVWWRTASKEEEKTRLAAVEEGKRVADNAWWAERMEDALEESREIQEELDLLELSYAPTVLTGCAGLDAYATKGEQTAVIRPQAV